MKEPVLDTGLSAQCELNISTNAITKKIPDPLFKLLIKRIQKTLAGTKCANITITFK
jgi:hypothetical protein